MRARYGGEEFAILLPGAVVLRGNADRHRAKTGDFKCALTFVFFLVPLGFVF